MTKIMFKPTNIKTSTQNADNAYKSVNDAKSTSDSLTIPSDFDYASYLRSLGSELEVIGTKNMALIEWLNDTPAAFQKTDYDIIGQLDVAVSGGTVGDPNSANNDDIFNVQNVYHGANGAFEINYDYWTDMGNDGRFDPKQCTGYAHNRVLYMYKQMLANGSITQDQYNEYMSSWQQMLAGGGANASQWGNKNAAAQAAGLPYFETGNEPKAGGVIVMNDGGAGHVIFIEGQDENGNWILSEGGYGYSPGNNNRNIQTIPAGNSPEEFIANLKRELAGGYYSGYNFETIIYASDGPIVP